MSAIGRIVLVGHCGFDSGSLAALARRVAPGLAVTSAQDDAALAQAGPDTLLLVNRVLDGSFDAADGINLIEQLNQRAHPPRAMLISNFAEAQTAAAEAGALPGFGKGELGSAAAERRLRQALAPVPETRPASMIP
jgi:two-component system, chemotaxis family, chemotaxis protein CheY